MEDQMWPALLTHWSDSLGSATYTCTFSLRMCLKGQKMFEPTLDVCDSDDNLQTYVERRVEVPWIRAGEKRVAYGHHHGVHAGHTQAQSDV